MTKFLQYLSGAIILGAVFLNASAVVSRYVFNMSYVWSDEVLVFANIATVAVGAIVAAIHGEHLSIDVIRSVLPEKVERVRMLLVEVLTFLVLSTAAYASTVALSIVGRSGQVSVAAGIPMTIPHGALFLSFLGIACIALFRIWGLVRGGRQT